MPLGRWDMYLRFERGVWGMVTIFLLRRCIRAFAVLWDIQFCNISRNTNKSITSRPNTNPTTEMLRSPSQPISPTPIHRSSPNKLSKPTKLSILSQSHHIQITQARYEPNLPLRCLWHQIHQPLRNMTPRPPHRLSSPQNPSKIILVSAHFDPRAEENI